MLYLPNEYSPGESRLKICVFKTDGSRWAMSLGAYRTRRRRVAAAGHHPRLPPSGG